MPTLPPSKRGYQLPLSELFLVAFVGEGTLKKHTTLEPILSPELGLYTLPDTNIAPENGGRFSSQKFGDSGLRNHLSFQGRTELLVFGRLEDSGRQVSSDPPTCWRKAFDERRVKQWSATTDLGLESNASSELHASFCRYSNTEVDETDQAHIHVYMYTCMFCMIYHESTTYNTYLILEKGQNTILHIMKCTRLLVCIRLHVQLHSHTSKQIYRHITR